MNLTNSDIQRKIEQNIGIPDYEIFNIMERDALYISRQVSKIKSFRKDMKNEYRNKSVEFLLRVIEKTKTGQLTRDQAYLLFSHFIPYTYDFFEDELSDAICTGSSLNLPFRKESTMDAVRRIEEQLKRIKNRKYGSTEN